MPFGLTNAPAPFQQWMNKILSEYLDIFCVAYLDDILIFLQNLVDHRRHVRTILRRVEETGLTLKASKCEFHTTETEYLGYVISPKGLQMDEEKIRTIKEWKEPTNVKGIQSFLEFANFYRLFIRDYSKITTPLSSLTRKEKEWEWGDKQQEAFDTLKTAMITEPILQHFNPERAVTIEMDASDYTIGAICSQPDDNGTLHPVAYYSRKLKDPERNYDIHDKELLVIVDALRKWDTYCKTRGPKITILMDHKNLEYWKTKKDLNLRQARWGERLANYDFVIKYRPGKLAGKPDILSRESEDSPWEGDMKHRQNHSRILLSEEVFEALQANTTETINLEIDKKLLNEIETLSAADKEIQEIQREKASGTTCNRKIALGLYEENTGLLMYDGLIWIPDDVTLWLHILRDHHDVQATGHPGQARTLELISRSFYWPGQRKYIHRYVDHCDTYHRIKPIQHAPFGLLKPLELPHRPWDAISTYYITALPMSNGKDALWVIIDRLTKMGHFVACQGTMNPEDLADHFL